MQEATPIKARRTEPSIPASDPRFVWTTGADVQAVWRRHGWVPPSESRANEDFLPAPELVTEVEFGRRRFA